MDLPIHDEILWHACILAERRLRNMSPIGDPRVAFPYLVRGSWMNDTNQVSPLLDKNQKVDVDARQNVLFLELWKLSLRDLLTDRARRYIDGGVLAPHTSQILAADQNVDGFGKYEPLDHLDVVEDVPGTEYDSWEAPDRAGRALTTDSAVVRHIWGRLTSATVDKHRDVRLDPRRLTILGRGLHSVADFFAHTNYVELLLWSLRWRDALDPGIADAFEWDDGSTDAGLPYFRCPLPAPGPPGKRNLRSAVIWYGPEPEGTPLVSSLFDLKDTTYSLLHVYAAHLFRTDHKAQNDQMLDLAMAVFDVQGAKLIKGAWEVLQTVSDIFEAIGRAARRALAAGIDAVAAGKDPTTRDVLHTAAELVRRYDGKEAREWARGGKISYLARELQLGIAKGLDGQVPATPLLPHHSLLAKDHVVHEGGGQLRHKLACILATEVTADLLVWHFSPAPDRDRYEGVRRRCLVHPWRLFDGGGFDDRELARRVRAVDGTARWQRLVLDGSVVLGSTP